MRTSSLIRGAERGSPMGTTHPHPGGQTVCRQFVTVCSPGRNEGALSLDPRDQGICCPECSADAYYRYGKTHQGKQKDLCLICGRQFTPGRKREEARERPACPAARTRCTPTSEKGTAHPTTDRIDSLGEPDRAGDRLARALLSWRDSGRQGVSPQTRLRWPKTSSKKGTLIPCGHISRLSPCRDRQYEAFRPYLG